MKDRVYIDECGEFFYFEMSNEKVFYIFYETDSLRKYTDNVCIDYPYRIYITENIKKSIDDYAKEKNLERIE